MRWIDELRVLLKEAHETAAFPWQAVGNSRGDAYTDTATLLEIHADEEPLDIGVFGGDANPGKDDRMPNPRPTLGIVVEHQGLDYEEDDALLARWAQARLIAAAPDALLDLLDVAEEALALFDSVGVEDLCSGSMTEYGCAGCPAHGLYRALTRLGASA